MTDTGSRQLTEPTVRHLQLGPTVGHTLLISRRIRLEGIVHQIVGLLP